MRFVHQDVGAVGAAHVDDLAQRRDVAANRIQPFDDDQPVAPGAAARASCAGSRPNCGGTQSPAQEARAPPGRRRNRLVVVEGLYSIRGDVAPLKDIVRRVSGFGAYTCLWIAGHCSAPMEPTGLGCAEAQASSSQVGFVVGTFSKSLAAVAASGSRISRAALAALSAALRLHRVGFPANLAGVSAAVVSSASTRSFAMRCRRTCAGCDSASWAT